MALQPRFVQAPRGSVRDPAAELADGLRRTPAAIAPKWFYDRLGSRLFDAITALPEYTPTWTEAEIFATHGAAIAAAVGAGTTLVDLGAGSCTKAAALFPLLEPRRYVAVDIATEHLHDALRRLQREHPALDITGVGMDFSASPQLPAGVLDAARDRPCFFYPGSSIGNFAPDEALAFLRGLHAQATGGGLLIGVDLVKPVEVLERGYDDEIGLTAAFNLNLLRHVNRVLGSDFVPARWRHVAFYDAAAARIEMHLESREAQVARWPGSERAFAAGERIHTENSHKFTVAGFGALLREAGFGEPRAWTDRRGWFALFHARA